ncbi:MAG: hypothetical protein N2490_04650 [Ignavibacteria bacterium]|nr:hypothetical protein [Ignavibacteria bacterium]
MKKSIKRDYIKKNLKAIEKLFGKKFTIFKNSYSLVVENQDKKTKISLDLIINSKNNSLISVYTKNSHLQLQNSNYFILSTMLDEVIFISENKTTVSGLIISLQGDCSLYSNVDKKLLKSDFKKLNSEELISAVVLSLIES